MMTIAYDPIAMELVFDPGAGFIPMVVRVDKLFATLYGDGYLGCAIDGESIDLYFEAAEEAPVQLMVDQVDQGHWRVRFIPLDLV